MGWVAAAVGVIVLAAAGGDVVWRNRSGGASATGSTAMPHIESVAVLPLANISADASQEYFAQAMTEELINQLSTIKSLRVISRTSSGQYSGTKLSMPEIASQLHVDGLIEGSVVRDGDRVRITAQLIYGPADRHVWANAYDCDLRDMLALQRRVAEAIAREVRATVTPAEQQALRGSRSVDPKAMELYLKGRESFFVAMHTAPGADTTGSDREAICEIHGGAEDPGVGRGLRRPGGRSRDAWHGLQRERAISVGSRGGTEGRCARRWGRRRSRRAGVCRIRIRLGHGDSGTRVPAGARAST